MCAQLTAFLPQLSDMDYEASFEVHSVDGEVERPITDLNQRKLDNLSRDELTTMTAVFEQQLPLLEAWGYELLA